MSEVIGRQPVLELLRSGRQINRLLVAKGQRQGSIREILALAGARGAVIQEVDRAVLDRLSEGANHQGVLAQAAEISYLDLEELLVLNRDPNWSPLLVVLDGIQDPHNLGSIMRSAEALGADGIVIPKRRSVAVTAAVMKSSAGAANHLPVCRVGNLPTALDSIKAAGYWVAGADMAGQTCFSLDLTGPLALVIGGEGAGLGRLVKQKCDFLCSIPLRGRLGSLNAAVAAAVLLYEVVRQRG